MWRPWEAGERMGRRARCDGDSVASTKAGWSSGVAVAAVLVVEVGTVVSWRDGYEWQVGGGASRQLPVAGGRFGREGAGWTGGHSCGCRSDEINH